MNLWVTDSSSGASDAFTQALVVLLHKDGDLENMENYSAIHKWITGLGFPETTQQYKTQITNADGQQDINEGFSDGTLHVLNSNFNDTIKVRFKDLFPVSLGSLEFQANEGDYNYFTAEVLFKYTVYNLLDTLNKPL